MPRTWRHALANNGWYKIHRNLQMLGVVVMVAGVAVSVAMVPAGYHFSGLHKALGLAMTIIALIQPVWALFRPHKPAAGEAPSGMRTGWRVAHALIGYGLLALGVVQLITGVGKTYNCEFLYGVYGAGFALTAIFAAVGLMWSKQRRATGTADDNLELKNVADAKIQGA